MIKLRLSSAVLILISTLPLFAKSIKLTDPRQMVFPETLDYTPCDVEERVLFNGIKVFLIEDHEFPMVDVFFRVDAAECLVGPRQAGLATILADLIVEGGSKTVPKRVFDDSLERVGASFAAKAGPDEVWFFLSMLSRHTDQLLPLVVGAIREPAFPQSQFDINLQQYTSMYRSRDIEPTKVAARIFDKLYYGSESHYAREITPASLEQISIESLSDFHHANYRPSRMTIGVIGDFQTSEMIARLEALVGSWQEPQEPAWEPRSRYADPAEPGVYVVHWPGSVQSSVFMAHQGLVRDDVRYPSTRIFGEAFGGSWYSRLSLKLRQQKGYAYSVGSYVSSGYHEPGMFLAYCYTGSQSTIDAALTLLAEIDRVKEDGLTEHEFDAARKSWLASFPVYYAEPGKVLLDRINYFCNNYPLDFWDRLPAKVTSLDSGQVNRFCHDFLEPDDLVILVFGDTTQFDFSPSLLGDVEVLDPGTY